MTTKRRKSPRATPRRPNLGQVGTDRLRGAPDLVRERPLLDRRKVETATMHLERERVGALKDLELLEVPTRPVIPLWIVCLLLADCWHLNPAASARGLSPVTSSARDGC
jgi:hypothetical protein